MNHEIIHIYLNELAELSQHYIDLLLNVCLAISKIYECYVSLLTFAVRDYNEFISIVHFYHELIIEVCVIHYADKYVFAYSGDNI